MDTIHSFYAKQHQIKQIKSPAQTGLEKSLVKSKNKDFMEKSITISALAKALSQFQSEMPTLHLDREVEVTMKSGGKYKFKYSTFSNLIETARPILAKHGLSYSQLVETDSSVTTILMHESGEFLQSNLLIRGEQNPQGIGSAITYAKRYSLSGILGVCADDDDDANMAEGSEFKTKEEDNRPWLNENTKEFAGAITKLKAGTTTIDKIKAVYKISKTIMVKLKEAELPNQQKAA